MKLVSAELGRLLELEGLGELELIEYAGVGCGCHGRKAVITAAEKNLAAPGANKSAIAAELAQAIRRGIEARNRAQAFYWRGAFI